MTRSMTLFLDTVFSNADGNCRIIDAAKGMFEKFASGDKMAIHPNIRGSVFSIVLTNGGKREVRTLMLRT